MSGPGGVTVLCATSGRYATKVFTLRRDGTVAKAPYSNARTFSVEARTVDGFPALAGLLAELERRPTAFVVRGEPLDGIDHRRARRLLYPDPETGDPATFRPEPRRWLPLDLDGVPNPWGLDPRVPGEGAELVEHVVGLLPPEFHDAGCFWQWTSSQSAQPGEAGPPATLRLRFWYWLDRAVPDADLERWANHLKLRSLPLDPAIYRPVQPIYVAAPIFHGYADPLAGRRSGLREGLDDEVALVLAEPEPARPYDGHGRGKGYVNGLGLDGGGVDFHLARIGPDGY